MPLLDDICDTCGHKYHEGQCGEWEPDRFGNPEYPCWCVKETP